MRKPCGWEASGEKRPTQKIGSVRFVVLDTNHFAELVHGTVRGAKLRERLEELGTNVFTSIVTAQEVAEGWTAFIRKQRPGSAKQVHGYQQFSHSLELLNQISILPFDTQAASCYLGLKKQFPQAGGQDLKIASICITYDATLLTRNLVDFQRIPGLHCENWLD